MLRGTQTAWRVLALARMNRAATGHRSNHAIAQQLAAIDNGAEPPGAPKYHARFRASPKT